LDRLLHHATTINTKGDSYRVKEKRACRATPPAATAHRRSDVGVGKRARVLRAAHGRHV